MSILNHANTAVNLISADDFPFEGNEPFEPTEADRQWWAIETDSDDSALTSDPSDDRTDPADSDDFLRPCLAGHDADWDLLASVSEAADRLEAAILF